MTTAARKTKPRKANGKPEGMDTVRVGLAKQVAGELEDRDLTQTEAAYIMKDAPSQISLVVTGKLRGFSTDRLLRMLNRLGRDIDIVVRPGVGRGTGKTRLVTR